MLVIRPSTPADNAELWTLLEPVIRAGETYALPRDLTQAEALLYWRAPGNEVFVAAEIEGERESILGTYFLRPNQKGGGAHVANCGYITHQQSSGRGVASAMCTHSLAYAKASGFRAMQFNFVVGSNTSAVDLWLRFGFEIAGRLPEAFLHPNLGYVDALVMYRKI